MSEPAPSHDPKDAERGRGGAVPSMPKGMPPGKWLRMKRKLEEISGDPDHQRTVAMIDAGLAQGFYDIKSL